MTPTPFYQDASTTIYHGDCREILPTLGRFDLLLTDPPYGIGNKWNGGNWQSGCGKGRLWSGNGAPEWDVRPLMGDFIEACRNSIVWGGNYFSGLPPMPGWLVWDKDANMRQAQAELAWSNCIVNVRCFRLSPLGVFGNGGMNGERKQHPTQKPVPLMRWCLTLVPDAQTILDPFMGSGTTLVAAKIEGRRAVGIEINERYCEIAAKRLQQRVFEFSDTEATP